MTPSLLDLLQMEIMNIPCKRDDASFRDVDSRLLYKEGHRDARYAAIEILLKSFHECDILKDKAILDALDAWVKRNAEEGYSEFVFAFNTNYTAREQILADEIYKESI